MNLKSEDRYTTWSDGHGCGLFGKDCYTQLAKYEDSGFTPEELQDVRDSILWSRAFGPEMTKQRFEEICSAESDGRLLILPIKVGDVIWRCEYPMGTNRMIPVQHKVMSISDIITLMFDKDHRWFKTQMEAWNYLKTLYPEDYD